MHLLILSNIYMSYIWNIIYAVLSRQIAHAVHLHLKKTIKNIMKHCECADILCNKMRQSYTF